MKKVLKTTLGVAVAAVTLGVTVMQGTASAWTWGDNSNGTVGRASYTQAQINSGALGDKIVLNSISDGVIGNEKNFVAAREYNGNTAQNGDWQADEITVEEGKTYMVRLYVHNNNPGGMNAVAEGVHTVFSIAQTTDTQVGINGFIDVASGANVVATEYWDDVVFKSNDGRKFRLDYVTGSGILENNRVHTALSDDIANTQNGVQIGYDSSLNGQIPGCFDYATYVAIQVRPVFEQAEVADSFSVEKKVRRVGETAWSTYVENLKVGDKVEYQIHYKNTSGVASENVMVQDVLPANMKYIAGTAKLYNTNYENGSPLEDALMTTGANIGGYLVNGDGYVRFTAEVVDDSLYCGVTKLVNWGKVTAAGAVAQASADVYVNKACATPSTPSTGEVTAMPATGVAGVVGGVVGAGALVTSAGYYLYSRKMRG